VQRASGKGPGPTLRGILLSLPENENPGGRWERELRGRFGSRVLPQVIPYDEEVGRTLLFGQIVCHASRTAPAAAQYHDLVENLGLAAGPRPHRDNDDPLVALRQAAAAVKTVARPRHAETTTVVEKPAVRQTPLDVPVPEPLRAERPHRHSSPALPDLPPAVKPHAPTPPPAPPVKPPQARPESPAPAPVAPSRTRVEPAKASRTPAPEEPADGPPWWGLLWVGLAVVAGVALRFLRMPDWVLPLLVGVGVAAVSVVLLRHFLTRGNDEDKPAPAPASPKAQPAESRRPARAEVETPRPRSGPSRRTPAPARGDVSDN
jgi:hypothetical protein